MRKIAATYIFPGDRPPLKNGILTCDDNGKVLDLVEKGDSFKDEAGIEYYSGILVPGFVNAHCHLELSHLQNKIKEKTGIGGFIGKINQLRNEDDDKEKAMQIADRKMWAAGIAAVGDISNSILSLDVKLNSKIYYHTFVEAFGFHPRRAEKSFAYAESVLNDFSENNLPASIVPHSPYSVSEQLFNKIKLHALGKGTILSIHNQESEGESEFYKTATGPITEHLQNNLGIDISHWQPKGKSSLQSILKYLPKENRLLLVHNTFTQKDDVEFLCGRRKTDDTFWVLCPGSNLYIENTLPNIDLFREEKLNICLGTDSLASNHQLSVLSEMLALQQSVSSVTLDELVLWATVNGAQALGIRDKYGSFDVGKTPGVNLITGIDFKQMKLTERAKVKRLI